MSWFFTKCMYEQILSTLENFMCMTQDCLQKYNFRYLRGHKVFLTHFLERARIVWISSSKNKQKQLELRMCIFRPTGLHSSVTDEIAGLHTLVTDEIACTLQKIWYQLFYAPMITTETQRMMLYKVTVQFHSILLQDVQTLGYGEET